jgi:hypothetical protein
VLAQTKPEIWNIYTGSIFLFKSRFAIQKPSSLAFDSNHAVKPWIRCKNEQSFWYSLPNNLPVLREESTNLRRFSGFSACSSAFSDLHRKIMQLSFQIYFSESRVYYKD